MVFHEIETERLMLKNISLEDSEFMLQQFSNDAVTKYLFDTEPLTYIEEAEKLINFYLQPEPRGQHRWILSVKNDSRKIGTCGFHCWDRAKNSVEIGYDLQEQYWGKGIMTEALEAILLFAINNMNIQTVNAHIYVDNILSTNLANKLGFVFNGKTELCILKNIEYLHNIYSLDCSTAKCP